MESWAEKGEGGLNGDEPVQGLEPFSPEPSSSRTRTGCALTMPFAPSFNAGSSQTTAGASTNFSATFGRHDGEQDLSGVTVHMPPGLTGKIPAVTLCGEAEALAQKNEAPTEGQSQPHCPSGSQIGTAVSLAGAGPEPFKSEEGKVYLTGPIKHGPFPNAPFGLVVDTPTKAGPFNLGHVVVLSGITVNPTSAAVTVTSEPLPQVVDGVQLRLREVKVKVTKPGFMLNPTNCSQQQVSATLGGLQGANANVASKFGITGCKNLLFHPTFTATTQAHTSKLEGASLNVKLTYPQGSNYANIAKTVTDLPIQLPSRLETLHKACVDTVFEANPAACPSGSAVGTAIARTPVLNQPLVGPAYLVSHGNRAFPDLEIVLQGEGVTVVLDGLTDIKKGITKTIFETVPDSPVESFELNLPEGSNSILAAPEDLCTPTRARHRKQERVGAPKRAPGARHEDRHRASSREAAHAHAADRSKRCRDQTGNDHRGERMSANGRDHENEDLGQRPVGDGQDERNGHDAAQRRWPEDDRQDARCRYSPDPRGADREGSLATRRSWQDQGERETDRRQAGGCEDGRRAALAR